MDNDFIAHVEKTLDEFRTRIEGLEKAVMQIPQINFQTDPSRPQTVVVEPAALTGA